MLFERVPIIGEIGTTVTDIFNQYGIPVARFNEIIRLPQNDLLRRSAQTPNTRLAPASGSICLPIDFDTVFQGEPVVDPNGLRWQKVDKKGTVLNREFLQRCTHGVKVRFARYYLDGTDVTPCKRIRWLQTVTKQNNPEPKQPPEFVDGGKRDGSGGAWPWYNLDDKDPGTLDDTPCGPKEPSPGRGLHFRATASVVVWTLDRITLVQCYTYGFSIKIGPTIGAILWDPYIRKATDDEVRKQIKILQSGIDQDRAPTGGNLIYNAPPPDGAINEGRLR
jgi:hypothetical protein